MTETLDVREATQRPTTPQAGHDLAPAESDAVIPMAPASEHPSDEAHGLPKYPAWRRLTMTLDKNPYMSRGGGPNSGQR